MFHQLSMTQIYTEVILYNISIGGKYFCYFLKYVFFNCTKIPLRDINWSNSLIWCMVLS